MNQANASRRPIAQGLHLVNGAPEGATVPYAVELEPPAEAARGRRADRLFVLLALPPAAPPQLYADLRRAVAQAYWSTHGSITSALRRAAEAVNRRLYRANLRAEPAARTYGGMVCAVSSGEDVFVLRAGPAWAGLLGRAELQLLTRLEDAAPMGIGPVADVRLHHTFVDPNATLLLGSPQLLKAFKDQKTVQVLGGQELPTLIEHLGRVAPGDFSALAVQWTDQARQPAPRRKSAREPAPPPPARDRPPDPAPTPAEPVSVEPAPPAKQGPGLGARVAKFAQGAGRQLLGVGRGLRRAGRGAVGVGKRLGQNMLPGRRAEASARAQRRARPVPEENPKVLIPVAIAIPVVVALLVALAYFQFGGTARLRGVIDQAHQAVARAEESGGITEASREHWQAALEHADQALALAPEDAEAAAIWARAQAALDLLDGIVRLSPVELYDFGPSEEPRRLAVHGQMIFILNPEDEWVAQVALDAAGTGVSVDESNFILVNQGRQIEGGAVEGLADLTWVGSGSGRRSSGVLILEETGALISYDPAWGAADGVPHLTRAPLPGGASETPRAVGSFEGRFYTLDAAGDQIWRYEPEGNAYPNPPSRYFAEAPPRPLAEARDMAIDGHIYVLYQDGSILKFLRGDPLPFTVSDVPGELTHAVDLVTDPYNGQGTLYVADRGAEEGGIGRVVALGPDGAFQAQYRADAAFDALETLAVDEATRRLYALSGGRLYVASLP
jgi:hypothetical protein